MTNPAPEFTVNWTSHGDPVWRTVLAPFVGKPIWMLEVGSFEGRSAVWFLDNVLTHPDARLACFDTWEGSDEHVAVDMVAVEARFDRNVASYQTKMTKVNGPSVLGLATWEGPPASAIYIDGSHQTMDVLADASVAWHRLAPGGVMIFDDYTWSSANSVKIAVDAFIAAAKASRKASVVSYIGPQAVILKGA